MSLSCALRSPKLIKPVIRRLNALADDKEAVGEHKVAVRLRLTADRISAAARVGKLPRWYVRLAREALSSVVVDGYSRTGGALDN